MALTLAAGISASDRYCTVNQPPTQPPGSYYRIGDEVVQHIGFATPTPIWSQTFLQLYIARGQLGTTAASHLSGAALTFVRSEFLSAPADVDPGPFQADGGGGGGVTVTDGVTTVAAATVEFPSGQVADAGAGTASVNPTIVQQNNAVGFDVLGLAGQSDSVVRIRQNDATGDALLITGEGPDANGPFGTRSLFEILDWQSNSLLDVRDSGRFFISTSNVGGDFAIFRVKDDTGAVQFEITNGGRIGFYGHASVARPEVPASPTVQDVVDALVALGLVTQAA